MSLRKEHFGMAPYVLTEERYDYQPSRNSIRAADFDNSPEISRSTLENVIGALLKKLADGETVLLTNEEIEDAPDIEIRKDFERDRLEFRTR
jgi:hypothetical protein